MRVMSIVLAFVLSAVPALAEQPIHDAMERAAAHGGTAQAAAPHHSGRTFWLGVAVVGAGSTVAILGATAFKSEHGSSGNAPLGSFQACEAIKANPVYSGNQCGVLKGPNLPVVWSGVAVAAAGLTLMAVSASQSSVEFGPSGVRFQHRIRF